MLDPHGRVSHETRSCTLNPGSLAYTGDAPSGSVLPGTEGNDVIAQDQEEFTANSSTASITLLSPSRNRMGLNSKHTLKALTNNHSPMDPFTPSPDLAAEQLHGIEQHTHSGAEDDVNTPTDAQVPGHANSEGQPLADNTPHSDPPSVNNEAVEDPIPWHLENRDIQITSHPNARKLIVMSHFSDYQPGLSADYNLNSVYQEPWRPFRMRTDFEIAELAQDTCMNKKQVQQLISLVKHCVSKPEIFTLIDEQDLTTTWEEARRVHIPNFVKSELTFTNPKTMEDDIKYDMMGCPLILKLIASEFARLGHAYTIEEIVQWLYPFIVILASDYEEQCIMAMIRGIRSLFPCPVCMIPAEEQSDLSKLWPLRTMAWMEKVYRETIGMSKENRNKALKAFGLRAVENVFWQFELLDVYSSLTWDRLHAYHIGLFRDHLLKEFLRVLNAQFGSAGERSMNTRLNESPCWPGLNHFSTITNFSEIADASKFEDLSKIILFAAYPLFTASNDKKAEAYRLLKLIRAYLDLDAFTALRNPSEKLVCEGEKLLQTFDGCLKNLKEVTTNPEKDWNFPKAHSHMHMFRDIHRKGATVNGNCKTFEHAHRPIRLDYQLHTNFKDVNNQIYHMNNETAATLAIRNGIEVLDKLEELKREAELNGGVAEDEHIPGYLHISLGSSSTQSCPISAVISNAPDKYKAAYQNLNQKIADHLHLAGALLGHIRSFPISRKLSEYHLICVEYKSLDDWSLKTDLVCAHSAFHKREWYDCLMYQVTDETVSFGRLLSIFSVDYNESMQHLALVIPYDLQPSVSNWAKDLDFGLTRVCQRQLANSIVIHVGSIVRAACLVPAWDCKFGDEYLLNCFLDPDIWLQSKLLRDGGLAWRA
ncbi:hypothetical protein FA15DRAFT_709284 [Coprinopsis marcescibilis]|uniref:Uncharacterized protein n=1 Tax=Coprinopsis marcescibilis TaxID=230819 RepID=A0A5C3KG11_COPMA|nr:hypothetical protein FA15DRAFT_709284 [Coprinopsis marcescibilis]